MLQSGWLNLDGYSKGLLPEEFIDFTTDSPSITKELRILRKSFLDALDDDNMQGAAEFREYARKVKEGKD